ncbi:hypothetical protein ACQPZ8_01685 [Actinomadura nitritigenes]|uniref:hypothetical protein n=1 Tax=Actinomadura nitritigenes TaxID=134602 RepID=UPI003D90C9D2
MSDPSPRNWPEPRWLPLDMVEGLVEQAIREALADRFFKGSVDEAMALGRRLVEELYDELARTSSSHCSDGPVTVHCPLMCLNLSARHYKAITEWGREQILTVGDLAGLVADGRLRTIPMIGPKAERAIHHALVLAGPDLAGPPARSQSSGRMSGDESERP